MASDPAKRPVAPGIACILAAVDFSDATAPVLELTSQLAKALLSKVVLLHVAAPNPSFVGFEAGPEPVREQRDSTRRSEQILLDDAVETLRGKGLEAEAKLVEGPTVDTILGIAESTSAGLIVVASHGRGALHRALLGSVSEGVLRHAKCPVLILPTRSSS